MGSRMSIVNRTGSSVRFSLRSDSSDSTGDTNAPTTSGSTGAKRPGHPLTADLSAFERLRPDLLDDERGIKPGALRRATTVWGGIRSALRPAALTASSSNSSHPLKEKTFRSIGKDLIKDIEVGGPSNFFEKVKLEFIAKSIVVDEALRQCASGTGNNAQEHIDAAVARFAEWRELFGNILSETKKGGADIQEIGEQCAIVPAPELSRLVFQGGGAKGLAYMGAMTMLEAAGALTGVKEVAGSSSGAITAALYACGGDFKEISHEALEQNTGKMVFAAPDARSAIPNYRQNLKLKTGFNPISRDGFGLVDLLDTQLRSSVSKKLDDIINNDVAVMRCFPCEDASQSNDSLDDKKTKLRNLADKLVDKLPKSESASAPGLTFGDLEKLANAIPDHFKHLFITAVDENKNIIYFNSKDSKFHDVPVSIAVRASSGLPVAFKPLKINLGKESAVLIDGGVRSNMPAEAFYPGKTEEFTRYRREKDVSNGNGATGIEAEFDGMNAETLLLAFNAGGTANKKLYGPPDEARKESHDPLWIRLASGNKNLNSDRMDDIHKIRGQGTNVVAIDTANSTTLSFNADPKSRLYAQIDGALSIASYLINRRNQGLVVAKSGVVR